MYSNCCFQSPNWDSDYLSSHSWTHKDYFLFKKSLICQQLVLAEINLILNTSRVSEKVVFISLRHNDLRARTPKFNLNEYHYLHENCMVERQIIQTWQEQISRLVVSRNRHFSTYAFLTPTPAVTATNPCNSTLL